MKFLLVFLVLLSSIKSFSIVGDDLNLKLDPVCKISIYSNKNNEFKGSCTGTLIDKNTVQTAAHCIFEKSHFVAECGQTHFDQATAVTKKVSPGKVYYTEGMTFKEKHNVLSATKLYSFFDKAVLKLEKASKLKPAKVESVLKLKELLQKDLCYFSGFGRNNGIVGKLNTSKIKTRNLSIDFKYNSFTFTVPKTELDSDVYLHSLQPNFRTAGSIAPGDSGSSVICVDANQVLSFGVANSVGNTKSSPYAMSTEATFSFSYKDDLKL